LATQVQPFVQPFFLVRKRVWWHEQRCRCQ
jgi:hypothetical protein